jgi:hypothetical protein
MWRMPYADEKPVLCAVQELSSSGHFYAHRLDSGLAKM